MGQRLSDARLVAQLQRLTVAHSYGDTGTLLHDTVTGLDEYGQPTTTTTSTAVACSFTDEPDMEKWKDYVDVSQISAEVRFADATPVSGDRFTITGRFDSSTYTDVTFEIVDIRDRDVFGFVCALKKVTA